MSETGRGKDSSAEETPARDAMSAWLDRAKSAPKVTTTDWGRIGAAEARPLFPGYTKAASIAAPEPQKLSLSKAPSLAPPPRPRPPSVDLSVPPMPPPPSMPMLSLRPEALPVIEPEEPAPPPGPDPELLALREEFASAALSLATAREEVIARAEESLTQLALDIAEAILGDAIAADPKYHRALARTALESLDLREGTARLRVSRESWDALVDVYGSARIDEGGRRAELILDPSLEGLGCVAESGEARVDGRIATRLAAVRKEFAESVRAAGAIEGEKPA